MSKFAGLGMAVTTAARMVITHPTTGQPLRVRGQDDQPQGEEAYLMLLAKDSPEARRHDRAMIDRAIGRRQRKPTAEELEADRVEKLAKLTKGWHLVALDGSPIDVAFSEADARAVYAEPSMAWLRDQAQEFSDDLGNYKAPPSTS